MNNRIKVKELIQQHNELHPDQVVVEPSEVDTWSEKEVDLYLVKRAIDILDSSGFAADASSVEEAIDLLKQIYTEEDEDE